MNISLENYVFSHECLSQDAIALESAAYEADGQYKLYVLLTDTNTLFSKTAKFITNSPYNHVSLMLRKGDFTSVFSYSISNRLNTTGGFMQEDKTDLLGSRYSLYSVNVTKEMYQHVEARMQDLSVNIKKTSYSFLGLVNAALGRGIFDSDEEGQVMICSQFVASIFEEIGISLFKDRALSTIQPYEFVKSKLLKYEGRGTVR